MENQFNSPTSSIASLKENRWTGEYVDNSPEFNPISYDFLPQSGSPKGDETPVSKKKRTSLKNFGLSPITAKVQQQRLLPPPPSERLEDLKKFTSLYKTLLSGTGDDEADEMPDSEDILLSAVMNSAECAENIATNESNDSFLTIKVPDKIESERKKSRVNNGASASKQTNISSLVSSSPSQKSFKTPTRRPTLREKSSERLRTNSQMSNRASASKQRENNRLVRSGVNQNSRGETSKPKVEEKRDELNNSFEQNSSTFDWLDDLVSNEILLLNDGNDDGFTCIDDTTLLSLCSGSQTTTTATQMNNTQEMKCKMDNNKISLTNISVSKVSARSDSSAKISAPNKCLTKVSVPNKCTAQEIERKRREAMKRLLERRKINSQTHSQKVS